MKSEVFKWVSECDDYERVKTENINPVGLLQPLPIPDLPWQDIALDFVEGLPSSNHKNTVLVIVYRLIEYGHFLALSHPYTAQDVTYPFLREVYKLHGLPKSIVTHRDAIFKS